MYVYMCVCVVGRVVSTRRGVNQSSTLLIITQATADFAYGAGGFPAWGIMPDSPLNFEIEVLSVA